MRKTTILIILSALIIGSIVATGKETVVEPSLHGEPHLRSDYMRKPL